MGDGGALAPTATTSTSSIQNTLKLNRGFYGWGHRFLWTAEMLTGVMASVGYEDVEVRATTARATIPELGDLERHGNYSVEDKLPNVIIVEGVRRGTPVAMHDPLDPGLDGPRGATAT